MGVVRKVLGKWVKRSWLTMVVGPDSVTFGSLTWPRYASHIEAVRIVDLKVLLHNCPFRLPLAIDGREEVLRIELIVQLLVSTANVKFISITANTTNLDS